MQLQILAERKPMQVADLKTLLNRVRQCGCRVTRQRAIILRTLCELDGHASAEQIHEIILGHGHDIDLSTVYRTMERLRDVHIVSQTDLGRGYAEFEIVTDRPHHHLICNNCGRVIDLDHRYLAPAATAIRQDFGFKPTFDHFAIFGLCPSCQQARRPM
jgi:Fur family ferric uptake transcriptional regulator